MDDRPTTAAADPVVLTGAPLRPADVVAVARQGAGVVLGPGARAAMEESRALVEAIAASERPVYGINTGFGALATTYVPPGRRAELQAAVVRSHAAGMGPAVETEVVRAMVVLRARTLATGRTGARPALVDALCALLDAGITPVVPEHGSLGASGDLAPLSHVGLCLLGEGFATDARGRTLGAAEALAAAGLSPLRLEAKEGLALINGTEGMLGMLVLATADAASLLTTADVTAAMAVEALLGTDRPFAADLQALRPHPGQVASAANLVRLLAGSGVVASHRGSDHLVQDAYSMRCHPQVAGAARDTLAFASDVAGRELAAAVDNPVVLADGRVESNGNFHGAPLGFAADFLAVAVAEVGAIAERRVDRLLDAARSQGLPPFLAPDAGVNSGLMLAQYAAAALVVEDRRLAAPASVDSVPSSAMQEDHVSMGWTAARKLRRVLDNAARILAVELVCAGAALDLRRPLGRPAPATAAVLELLRTRVGGPGPDRAVAPDLAAAFDLVTSGAVAARAEEAAGPLE